MNIRRFSEWSWELWDTEGGNLILWDWCYEKLLMIVWDIEREHPGMINELAMVCTRGATPTPYTITGKELDIRMRQTFHAGIERIWRDFEAKQAEERRDTKTETPSKEEGQECREGISG